MNNPKFQVFKSDADNQYFFHLRATNGEIILSSEGYVNKDGCLNGIVSVKINAPLDERYAKHDAAGDYTFSLTAANGEVIGSSETYTTAAARDNGIAAVVADAPVAPVEELG